MSIQVGLIAKAFNDTFTSPQNNITAGYNSPSNPAKAYPQKI